MNSIRDELVAFDTNVFLFALSKHPSYPACETLVFDRISELKVYIPLQFFVELQRNLHNHEMSGLLRALLRAKTVTWDYAPAPMELITRWEQQGAKKGDAVIAAHLEAAKTSYLISENRHFLTELPSSPFQVLRSEEAIELLRK